MSDWIQIEGIEFYAFHGVSAEEQQVGHRYRVDVEIGCDLAAAGHSDDVGDTVDYGAVVQRVVAMARGRQFRLLEALAAHLAEGLLHEFPLVERVQLRVGKVLPPIDAVVAYAGVEIERARE